MLKKRREKCRWRIMIKECLYEKTNFNIYEVGRNVLSDRVFSARDMTSEAAVAKLMWVLGDPEKRMKLIEKNVCGEMRGAGK